MTSMMPQQHQDLSEEAAEDKGGKEDDDDDDDDDDEEEEERRRRRRRRRENQTISLRKKQRLASKQRPKSKQARTCRVTTVWVVMGRLAKLLIVAWTSPRSLCLQM